jgi:hypothetical protein
MNYAVRHSLCADRVENCHRENKAFHRARNSKAVLRKPEVFVVPDLLRAEMSTAKSRPIPPLKEWKRESLNDLETTTCPPPAMSTPDYPIVPFPC